MDRNSQSEELGRYREVEPEMIIDSSKIIKKGKVYDLAMEVNREMTIGDPPQKDIFPSFNLITYLAPEKNKEYAGTEGITWGTELIIGGIHSATHLDALSHVQYNGKIFGKYDVRQDSSNFGMKKCGVETVMPIISRGIMVDVAEYLDVEKLEDDHKITRQEVVNTLEAEDIELKFGDTILIRTGKIKDFYMSDYINKGPGIGLEAAIWLYNQGMCVLGSDYTSIEPKPLDLENSVHKEMLYDRGIYLMENLYLEKLSQDKTYQFFFVCLPIKITGSTGSWIRTIAII